MKSFLSLFLSVVACHWSHGQFYASSVDLGEDWRQSLWLGIYYAGSYDAQAESGWIYTQSHGSIYISGENPSAAWMYHPNLGWLWSGEDAFPLEYSSQEDSWLWHERGSEWFYSFRSNLWLKRDATLRFVEGGSLPASSDLGAVEVSSFYIGKYEVTWREWKVVRDWAASNGYDIGSVGSGCEDDHPVHSVNWYDVMKWCNARSEMEGLTPVYVVGGTAYRADGAASEGPVQDLSANGYRLPLEAEWEFAARGGNQTNGYIYSGSNDLNEVGWYGDNATGAACDLWAGRGTQPVGQKAPNELGLYDMSGNVAETCWDHDGFDRNVRGGSWGADADSCTVSTRGGRSLPENKLLSGGLRLARSLGR